MVGWKWLCIAWLALAPLEHAHAHVPPAPVSPAVSDEEFTGTVTRILPDAIELKSKSSRKVFKVPIENRAWLTQLQPGDRVTLGFECDARELRVLHRARRDRQQGGEVPQAGKPIIDDRAFYGAKIHSDAVKPQG